MDKNSHNEYQQYLLKQLEIQGEKSSVITEFMNSIILPYKYFKKLNILPLNIVEGEIDKHFQTNRILLENYYNIPSIIKLDKFDLPISNNTITNYCKFYNNIPVSVINKITLRYDIFNNINKYENIIDSGDYTLWTNRLYNNLQAKYFEIKKNLTKLVKEFNELEDKINQEQEEAQQVDLKPDMVIRFCPTIFGNLKYKNIFKNKYFDFKIIKICPKSIKLQELVSSNNLNIPKIKLVKINIFNDLLNDADCNIWYKEEWNKNYPNNTI